jgi:hypothetical protein
MFRVGNVKKNKLNNDSFFKGWVLGIILLDLDRNPGRAGPNPRPNLTLLT